MKQGKSSVKVWICYALLCIVWGSSFIMIKKGVSAFSPLQLAVLRMVSVLPIFGLLVIQSLKKIPKNKLIVAGIVGLISTFIPSILFGLAQKEVNSALAGILNATTPMFTIALGASFFQDRLKAKQIIGLILGFISVLVLILLRSEGPIETNIFSLFIILATLGYGLNINIVRHHLKDLRPIDVTTVALFISGSVAVFFFIADFQQYTRISRDHPGSFFAILTLGILGTALAQYLQNLLVKSTSAIFASSTTYVIPIIAIGWGLVDGEQIHWATFIAVIGIFLSIFLLRKTTP